MLDCCHTFGAGNENDFLFCDMEAPPACCSLRNRPFGGLRQDPFRNAPRDRSPRSSANNEAACRMFWNGMLRVVDVRRVLENCRCRGAGCVRIAVEDAILPENTGTWKLTFAPNSANLVEKRRSSPTLPLTINAFSALICGARDTVSCVDAGRCRAQYGAVRRRVLREAVLHAGFVLSPGTRGKMIDTAKAGAGNSGSGLVVPGGFSAPRRDSVSF